MKKSVIDFLSNLFQTKMLTTEIFEKSLQQIAESQEKQQNFQKLVDDNRKLDSNVC